MSGDGGGGGTGDGGGGGAGGGAGVGESGPWRGGEGPVCGPGEAKAAAALLYESRPELLAVAVEGVGAGVSGGWWFLFQKDVGRLGQLSGPESPLSEELRGKASLIASKIHYHLAGTDYDASIKFALRAGIQFYAEKNYKLYVDAVMVKGLDRYLEMRRGKPHFPESEEKALEALGNKVVQASRALGHMWRENMGFLAAALEASELAQMASEVEGGTERWLDLLTSMGRKERAAFRSHVPQALSPLGRLRALLCLEDVEGLARELHQLTQDEKPGRRLLALQAAADIYLDAPPVLCQKLLLQLSSNPRPAAAPVLDVLSGAYLQSLFQHFLVTHHYHSPTKYYYSTRAKTPLSPKLERPLINRWLELSSELEHMGAVIAHGLINLGSGNTEALDDNPAWAERADGWTEFCSAASLGLLFRHNSGGSAMEALRSLDILPGRVTAQGSPGLTPPAGPSNSAFALGGGLFGLGLVGMDLACPGILRPGGRGEELERLLLESLDSGEEGLRVGAALGLGAAGAASWRRPVMDKLLGLVQRDVPEAEAGKQKESVAWEGLAAGLAAGLVMLGRGCEAGSAWDRVQQMLSQEQRPHFRRGLGLGLALMAWGTGEACGAHLEELMCAGDWELRRSGVLALGCAWVGSGEGTALRRLLRLKSRELKAEVGGAVGVAIGLILAGRGDEESLFLLQPLLSSHSPLERYGAVMGLGLGRAGSGSRQSLRLLAAMAKGEKEEAVAAAVFLAASLIASGRSAEECPEWSQFRATALKLLELSTIPGSPLQTPMLNYAWVLGLGVAEAGSGAAAVELVAEGPGGSAPFLPAGPLHQETALGLFLLSLHWDWVPLGLLVCVGLRPASLFLVREGGELADVALGGGSEAEAPRSGGRLGQRQRRLPNDVSVPQPSAPHRRLLFFSHALPHNATHPNSFRKSFHPSHPTQSASHPHHLH